jgi:hypothetical protein
MTVLWHGPKLAPGRRTHRSSLRHFGNRSRARHDRRCPDRRDKSRSESDTLDSLSNDRAAAWPEACAGLPHSSPHSSQLVKALWKSVSCPKDRRCPDQRDKSRAESDTLDPLSNDRAAAWSEACAGPPHSSQLIKALSKSVSCPTGAARTDATSRARRAIRSIPSFLKQRPCCGMARSLRQGAALSAAR